MSILVLDVGGTAIKSGIYTNGEVTHIRECPSEGIKGGPYLMGHIYEVIAEYRERYDFDRIGISSTGMIDPVEGNVIYSNKNVPDFTGTRIAQCIEERFRIPTKVDNDVRCAALGEAYFGAGRNIGNFLCITYGTGIGGAIFIDGRLYKGVNYTAAAFGALITHAEDADVSDGDYYAGGYERYASTSALVRKAKAYDAELTDGRRVFEAIGDPNVKKIVDNWIDEIILGLRTLIHILNPGAVILGGGILAQSYILDEIHRKLPPLLIDNVRSVKLIKAELGNNAGMYGAAMLFSC